MDPRPEPRRSRIVSIEDEIKQPRFAELAEKALVNLIYTTNFFEARAEQLLKSYELTPQQYNILRILRGQQGQAISLLEVKSRMLDRNPDVSRIVDRMVRKGLVDRQICPTDRRQADLTITAHGLELLSRIDPHISSGYDTLRELKDSDLERLSQLLDRARGGQSLGGGRRHPARRASAPGDAAQANGAALEPTDAPTSGS